MRPINFIFFFLSFVISSQEISIKLNGEPISFKPFFSRNNIILKSDTLIKIEHGIYDISNNEYVEFLEILKKLI